MRRGAIGAAEAVASMQSGNMFPPIQNARQATEVAKIKDPDERSDVWGEVNGAAEAVANVHRGTHKHG